MREIYKNGRYVLNATKHLFTYPNPINTTIWKMLTYKFLLISREVCYPHNTNLTIDKC